MRPFRTRITVRLIQMPFTIRLMIVVVILALALAAMRRIVRGINQYLYEGPTSMATEPGDASALP
jgi:hypothetical protein